MLNPSVWAVILNFNRLGDTLACLSSLERSSYPNLTVLVLNWPAEESWRIAMQAVYPSVRIIGLTENRGYAGNNNIGIRHALQAGADWVFVLNEDTVIDSICISELVFAVSHDPSVGIVGPKVYQADRPKEIQAAGGMLDAMFDVRWRGTGEVDGEQYNVIAAVDIAHGCALMLSRRLLEAIGGFDERFFLYREEVDLCMRATRAGYKVLFVPRALVWHRRPIVSTDRQALTTYYMTRNTYLLLANRDASLATYARTIARHLVWLVNWSINPKWRHKQEDRKALFKGLIDALLHRFGKQAHRYGI